MRRALLTTVLSVTMIAPLGCDSPPPTTEAEATTRGPATSGGPTPSGLAKLSPDARNDRPMGAPAASSDATPAATATATVEPKSVTAQHVLVAYKGAKRAPKGVTRSKADAKKRAEEIAEKAKAGDDFSELVKKHSDEPGAAERLGNVGRFERNAMAKPFEDATFALEVGKVSGAVETEFGFHVIKRNQ